jgi:hypothetical protein
MLREELVSESKQLAAERSLTADVFSQGWSQGIELGYKAEAWRFAGAFSDGLNSRNTDFNTRENINNGTPFAGPFTVSGEAEYALTARFEWMFSGGNWETFDDFTSAKGQEFSGLLGAAIHWQESDNTALDTDLDRDTFQGTIDVSLEGDSWNAFGAFIGRYTDVTNSVAVGGGSEDFWDMGFVLQGGYRFGEGTEIFARWDGLLLDSDRNLEEDTFNTLTFGLNQYYAGHAAKATVDFMYLLESSDDLSSAVGLSSSSTGQGLLGDTEEGEFVIRLQFQLLF